MATQVSSTYLFQNVGVCRKEARAHCSMFSITVDSQPAKELQQVENGLADNFERGNFSPSNLFNTAEDDTVKECDELCRTEGAISQPTDL